MGFLTTGTIFKIALELTLGVCMKLFCDNGRIHYKDFINDFLFWVPGVESEDGDGLTREVTMRHPAPQLPAATPESLPLAAK